jgi:enterochelin esterase-like enzyme
LRAGSWATNVRSPSITRRGRRARRYGLVVLLDGQDYVRDMSVATILDNLIGAGRVPPVVGVFSNSLGQEVRSKEMACDPAFNVFLEDE